VTRNEVSSDLHCCISKGELVRDLILIRFVTMISLLTVLYIFSEVMETSFLDYFEYYESVCKSNLLNRNQMGNARMSRHMDIKFTILVVIGTDCIGSCKCNYHTITTTTVIWYTKYILHCLTCIDWPGLDRFDLHTDS
jgi:hypothetical protein